MHQNLRVGSRGCRPCSPAFVEKQVKGRESGVSVCLIAGRDVVIGGETVIRSLTEVGDDTAEVRQGS